MLDKALEQKLGTLEIKQGMRIKKEEIALFFSTSFNFSKV